MDKIVDLAGERRAAIEAEFRKRDLVVAVPKPAVRNREFGRRSELEHPMDLFYRPGQGRASYEQIMFAFGQAAHWTVTDENKRGQIGWKPTETGYWFWGETQAITPRLAETWNNLMRSVCLFWLEEYMLMLSLHKALTGKRLDAYTDCLLRTRFGNGSLRVRNKDNQVCVEVVDATALTISADFIGGRIVRGVT